MLSSSLHSSMQSLRPRTEEVISVLRGLPAASIICQEGACDSFLWCPPDALLKCNCMEIWDATFSTPARSCTNSLQLSLCVLFLLCISLLSLFLPPHHISSPLILALWGMFLESLPTPVVGGMHLWRLCSPTLTAAAYHKLPWRHLATEASDSLSWLGAVKPVKWNRWASVAVT